MTLNNNETIEVKLTRALAFQTDNHVNAAMQLFNEILLEIPNQPDALHGMGMAYAQQRQYNKAATYLEQAVQATPMRAEYHNNLANAYKAIGKLPEAMRHYHQALRLKHPYPQAHNNLGTLLYKLGNFKEASEHFQKSLRMDPFAIDTHYNIANCYVQLDRLLEAAAHFKEVLKLRPEHLGALHNLGITLCALKQFVEALPLLEQVIIREPTNVDALFHLGVIYSALAKGSEAKECYEKVLALDPKHANSHHNLATIYLHLAEPKQALAHYQQALALDPANKTAQHMINALLGKPQDQGAPFEYTRALFDQYAYNYDQHVKTQLHYQVPHLLRSAITPLLSSLTPPLTALDLGCGTGLCAPLFSDIVGTLDGLDLSPNMVEVARLRGGYHKLFVTDALSYLTMHLKQYNLIIAADVLVYFGNLTELFTACFNCLTPNGLFGFSIEMLKKQSNSSDLSYQLQPTGRYAHQATYLHKLATEIGFKVVIEEEVTLRQQEERPVAGKIYIFQKL